MSGTYPATPVFNSASLGSISPSLVSHAANMRRQARKFGGHAWTFRASYPPMTRAVFAPVMAFVMAQRGEFESFTIVLPELSTPQGDVSGSSPLVNGASQSGGSLITDGWQASTLVFKAGDVFRLAGNPKVYMVTADETSDGSGNLTLSFIPDLVASPAENEVLTVSAVPFTMALTNEVQEFAVSTALHYRYEVGLVEVIS